MSWTPTDEQVRDVHADVVAKHYPVMDRVTSERGLVENSRRCHCGHPLPWAGHDLAMEQHRLHEALVAVGPHIAAQALRDAARTVSTDIVQGRSGFADSWLRGRADRIEEEAGR